MDLHTLLDDYEYNHQSAVCRATHAVGIPLIAFSIPVAVFSRRRAAQMFVLGWLLQFAGHAVEGKRPKFFEGGEYLLAGFVWWLQLVASPMRALLRR